MIINKNLLWFKAKVILHQQDHRLLLFLDKVDPLTSDNKLCSGFVNYATLILQNQFPDVGGLYCCTLGQHINFPKATGEKFVQIVHDGHDHWLVVAKGFSEQDLMLVYDSMAGTNWKSQHVIGCMSSLLRTPEKQMRYKVKACQRQGNGFDCGVFAIAFATSLVHGEDPSELSYTPSKMRDHLRNCINSNSLTPFPSTKSVAKRQRRENIAMEDIYCSCRRGEYMVGESTMVECDKCLEWFHKSCVTNFPKTKKEKWLCQNCTV